MSSQEPGTGKLVCATCLGDKALQTFANEYGKALRCDYCGSAPATRSIIPLDDVITFLRKALSGEWAKPQQANILYLSTGQSGPSGIRTSDLFEQIGFTVHGPALFSDMLKAFGDERWSEKDWTLLSPSKRWIYGWEHFQEVVKHERRYTFWYAHCGPVGRYHRNVQLPSQVLEEIAVGLNEMDLVKTIPAGTAVWRLQLHSSDEALATPQRFTSPPSECAKQPNRMSPAGVPMFYGADDFETAKCELVDSNESNMVEKSVSGAQFKNVIPINMLDMTSIPSPPSYLSRNGPFRRHLLAFLRKFAEDLSQPIKRDECQYIEYVPTQVFTEFVRHIMKASGGAPIHGIRYSSSRNGRPCCAIFATQDECLPERDQLVMKVPQILEFVSGSIKVVAFP